MKKGECEEVVRLTQTVYGNGLVEQVKKNTEFRQQFMGAVKMIKFLPYLLALFGLGQLVLILEAFKVI